VRSRRGTRSLVAGALALLMLLAAAAPLGAQQGVRSRRLGIWWRRSVPHISFSARDLVDANVRKKLRSGLPQMLVMRTYAYSTTGVPIAVAPVQCRAVYDLWEEIYRVQVQTSASDRTETLTSIDAVLGRCLVVRHMPVGEERAYELQRGRRVYFAVLVELNPLSPDTVQRIRRWLARPGGGRVEGEAFFGSFVSLFVNRRIGAAERTVRFRSPPVTVP